MATHSSILAWEIPRTEEHGGLQSTGSKRVVHDLVTKPPPPNKLFAESTSKIHSNLVSNSFFSL